MVSDVEVRTLEARPALVIRATTTADEISEKLSELLPEVVVHAQASGAGVAGAPFTRYLAWNPDGSVELEAGVPVLSQVPPEGRIEPIELPSGEVAMVLHTGPYTLLGDAHAALGAWVRANGRQTSGPCWESYVSDPAAAPPDQWQTEVYWPLK
jgi:effector-binding domain-containing protein